MANIQVKRSTTKIAPDSALLAGEIAQSLVSNTSKYLYVGDGTTQLAVGSADTVKYYQAPVVSTLNAAPAHTAGNRYIVGTSPSGWSTGKLQEDWSTVTIAAGDIVESDGTNWVITADASAVGNGLTVYDLGAATLKTYTSGAWQTQDATVTLQEAYTNGANGQVVVDTSHDGGVIFAAGSDISAEPSPSVLGSIIATGGTANSSIVGLVQSGATASSGVISAFNQGTALATGYFANTGTVNSAAGVVSILHETSGTAVTGGGALHAYVGNSGAGTQTANVSTSSNMAHFVARSATGGGTTTIGGSVLAASSQDAAIVTQDIARFSNTSSGAVVNVLNAVNSSSGTGITGSVAAITNSVNATGLDSVLTVTQSNGTVAVPAVIIANSGTGPEIKLQARTSDPTSLVAGGTWYHNTTGELRTTNGTNTYRGAFINSTDLAANEVLVYNGTTFDAVSTLAGNLTFSGSNSFSGSNELTTGSITTGTNGVVMNGSTDTLSVGSAGSLTVDAAATFTFARTDFSAASSTTVVNKGYVDGVAAGLDPKQSVRAATTGVLSGTMIADNGTPATGERSFNTTSKTINWFTGEGPTTIDGVTLANTNRILVKSETSTSGPSAGEGRIYNGIYVRTSQDVWTRSDDQDGSPAAEVSGGNFTFVEQGTANSNTGWVVVGDGVLTLQTDNIIWTQFTGAGSFTAGNGLSQSGSVLSLDLSGGELAAAGGAITTGDTLAFYDTSATATVGRTVGNILTDLNLNTGSNAVFSTVQVSAVKLDDTDSAFVTNVQSTSTNTADRTLTLDVDNADRTLRIGGNVSFLSAISINTTSASSGNALVFDGTDWVDGQVNLASTAAVTGTLPVANGGTGATTLTSNGILVGNGTSAVSATTLTNGQILIGSTGNAPVAATLTDGSGVSITEGAGTITIALDINGLTADTVAAGDFLPFYDISGSDNNKITFANFEAALALNNISGTLGVSKGGTGLSTIAKGTVLVANAVDTLTALDGATASAVAAADQAAVLVYSSALDTLAWTTTIDAGLF